MSDENVNKVGKKSVLITVDRTMHEFAKEHIKNFSGFVDAKLREFSGSVAEANKNDNSKE